VTELPLLPLLHLIFRQLDIHLRPDFQLALRVFGALKTVRVGRFPASGLFIQNDSRMAGKRWAALVDAADLRKQ